VQRNSRSIFVAEHSALTTGAIRRYVGRETFFKRLSPVEFRFPLSQARSAQLFAAFEPFMESLGVPAPSNDCLDQVMHQVVIRAFIHWATHDEEIFESVKRHSSALAAVLSCETEEAEENRVLIREAEHQNAVHDILAGSATPNAHAEPIVIMSEQRSNMLFWGMESFLRLFGVHASNSIFGSLMLGIAVVGFLSWIVKE
jgi:hypothetical protein